jgi:hypothetical protein
MRILTQTGYVQTSLPILGHQLLKGKPYFLLMKYKVAQKPFNHFVFFTSRNPDYMKLLPACYWNLLWKICHRGELDGYVPFYVSHVVRRIFTGKRTRCTTRNEKNATALQPLNLVFHNRLNDLLKKFMLIGGMLEVVKTYIGNNMDFVAIQRVLSDITLSYIDDFVKYKKRSPLLRLREVMGAVIKQNGEKFIYSKAGKTYQILHRQKKPSTC